MRSIDIVARTCGSVEPILATNFGVRYPGAPRRRADQFKGLPSGSCLYGARRRWTLEEKHQVVAESYGGPRSVSVTARRNGLSASQLSRGAGRREDRLSGDAVPALVPVEIAFTPALASTCTPQPTSSPPAQRARLGIIEIDLGGGCRIRVDRDVDAEALQRCLNFGGGDACGAAIRIEVLPIQIVAL
ncbi:transposase [Bradyrhizobium rifense]|uniref:Transposase n=2 Tax=Bradyrhizobium rifense TaxID=515499 RepID=A0A5D3K9Z5_9BRAD|nr:transposase [Bradyrhizobium rifense]